MDADDENTEEMLFEVDRCPSKVEPQAILGKAAAMMPSFSYQSVGDKTNVERQHTQVESEEREEMEETAADTEKEQTSTYEETNALIQRLMKPSSEFNVEEIDLCLDFSEEFDIKKRPKLNESSQEILKMAVVKDGFEKMHTVPIYSQSKAKLKRQRKAVNENTKKDWFNMKKPELTEELKADVEAIHMKKAFGTFSSQYKRPDTIKPPKFFQLATVEDSPVDFYHSRLPQKMRKQTIVDELLADADLRNANKKAFERAQRESRTRKYHQGQFFKKQDAEEGIQRKKFKKKRDK